MVSYGSVHCYCKYESCDCCVFTHVEVSMIQLMHWLQSKCHVNRAKASSKQRI